MTSTQVAKANGKFSAYMSGENVKMCIRDRDIGEGGGLSFGLARGVTETKPVGFFFLVFFTPFGRPPFAPLVR